MSVTLPKDYLDWSEDERMRLLDVPEVYVLTCGRPRLGRRFIKLFQQAWALMPLDAVEQISAYWQSNLNYPLERIVLLNAGQGRIDNDTLAITLRSGHRIEFHQQMVTRSPDRPFIGLILHELAHVYGHARGDTCHKDEYQTTEEQLGAEESVEKTLRDWCLDGYEEELQEWLNDNPEWYEGGMKDATD